MISGRRMAVAFLLLGFSACDQHDEYTLYRSSPLDPNARIHIATFDAKDRNPYNQENCRIARELFQQQPGVTVRYWCEKGRFRG